MIVYNTTFYIQKNWVEPCLDYLKKEYIPAIVAGGTLVEPSLRRVLVEQEDESESFALQFLVADGDLLNEWLEKEGYGMQKMLIDRFERNIVGFSTLMEVVDWEA